VHDPLLILLAAGVAGLVATGVGALLVRAARPSPDAEAAARDALVARVEDCLPRTQCAQCGYPGCRPYAEAILAERVGIDRCPPGGQATIRSLARLLDRPVVPLASDVGTASGPSDPAGPAGPTGPTGVPSASDGPPPVARIIEADCIGCALCLPACPTDAIVGAHRLMHTVIATDCTGCELCVAPCPVDCIVMQPRAAPAHPGSPA